MLVLDDQLRMGAPGLGSRPGHGVNPPVDDPQSSPYPLSPDGPSSIGAGLDLDRRQDRAILVSHRISVPIDVRFAGPGLGQPAADDVGHCDPRGVLPTLVGTEVCVSDNREAATL